MADTELLDGFRDYLREGHFLASAPRLVPLSLALYRRLGAGAPVARSELAGDLGQSVEAVVADLGEFPDSTLDFDQDGTIIAFGGLSIRPARHQFSVGDLDLYTWCVFDALFLPELLGQSAISVTRCPATDTPIEISLTPSAVAASTPASPVMSIVAPDGAACRANLRGAFCNHVSFFADEVAFRQWAGDRPDTGHVSLAEAHGLAQQRNRYRYGDLLDAAG